MKMNDFFPSKYLKAEDLTGDTTVTITSCMASTDLKDRQGNPEVKPVVSFSELDKAIILNKTNWKTIEKLHGADSNGWVGKAITLFTMDVDAFGDIVSAIRVRSEVVAQDFVTLFWVKANELNLPAETSNEVLGKHAGDFEAAYNALAQQGGGDEAMPWDAPKVEIS